MSLALDGQHIHCDGAGCKSIACAPVALRPLLALNGGCAPHTLEGWLFVIGQDAVQHFCPICVGKYLSTLSHIAKTESIPLHVDPPQEPSGEWRDKT